MQLKQLQSVYVAAYLSVYAQVWDSAPVQQTLNSSGRKWTGFKILLLPITQVFKVIELHVSRVKILVQVD